MFNFCLRPNRNYPLRTLAVIKKEPHIPQKDFFFIPTEIIRKLLTENGSLSDEQATCTSTAAAASNNEETSSAIISKYLCPHKRLNPFAINKLKIVSRWGIEKARSELGIDWLEQGLCLPCYDEQKALCWDCLYACYEYARSRDTIKAEAKKVKALLELEYDADGEEASIQEALKAQNVNLPSTPKKKKTSDNENDDIIVLEDTLSSELTSNHKNRCNSKSSYMKL